MFKKKTDAQRQLSLVHSQFFSCIQVVSLVKKMQQIYERSLSSQVSQKKKVVSFPRKLEIYLDECLTFREKVIYIFQFFISYLTEACYW